MLRLAAGLPDALVGLAPDLGGALGLRLHDRPQPPGQALAVHRVLEDRVEHGAEDVVLALVKRAVADPHRVRARIAREILTEGLGQVAAAVDPVHDLQPAVAVGLEVGDELHELVRLPVESQEVQRLEREGRVAHPRVAVVPVALAARRLRKRGRQRGHRRPGRHVGQALDRQRRALDRLAPAVVGERARPGEPTAPEADRLVDPALRVVDVVGRRQALAPGERGVGALAGLERVPGADPVGLDAERQVGLQPDRLAGAGGIGRVAAVVDERPLGRRRGRSRRPARRSARARPRPRGR